MSPRRWRDARLAVLLLAPAVLGMVAMRVVPAVSAFAESFNHLSLRTGVKEFVGFENYAYLLGSGEFHAVLGTTLLFNLVLNPVIVVLSTALALLLAQRLPAVGLWRSLIFVPAAVPGSVTALIWSTAMQPDGLLNALFAAIGLPKQPFLTSSGQALGSIGLMLAWGAIGYWMLFVVAGLKDIPQAVYEAALIDGAGWWRRLTAITLPLLRRPMAFVLVAGTVGSFLAFAPVQILTKGGPDGSTNLLMYDVYANAYQVGDLGVAQAEVVLLMILMAVVVAIQFRVLREERS
ncbi:carbohydrate ABC transporter permease [Kribbella sandramycini]|nr:sugar ABC transporter permease [Kribbella sandramycini]MBB6571388.1 multiple sugar transport system permease protein [Kribbella sandramycini]